MQDICAGQIKEIYNLLGDNISKSIFENRLMYSLTEDARFIRNVVCTIDPGRKIYADMAANRGKIGIFGAGDVGRHLAHIYDDMGIVCFIDNKKAGSTYEGLPVISLNDFKETYPEGTIVISTKLFYKEIMTQLLEEKVPKENIINLGMEYEKLNHLQYFDLPQLEHKRAAQEVFVDGGCYDGATAMDFRNWSPGGGVLLHGSLTLITRRNAGCCLRKTP